MKRLLLAIPLVLVLFATAAPAQLLGRFGATQIIAGGTNNVLNLASNSYSLVIDCRDVNELALQISCPLIVSNFCKPRLDFMESADGSSWSSTNHIQVTCLGGFSTNNLCDNATACYVTNLSVKGIQALKLFRIANTDYHGIMTNVTVSYSIKR